MGSVPERASIVVIGAGIVGSALVRHLAELGERDILLIDKGPLPDPGGSTGHASNFVFPVDHSREITDLTLDSMRQYDELGVLIGSGGVEVARTPERLQEFTRRMSSAESWGVEAELVSPARIRELVPYVREDLLLGGFHTPSGAIVDAVRAGEMLRARAEELGALAVAPETEVTGIDTAPSASGPRVSRVRTDRGDVETELVVIACGVWSPRIAEMAGATIPLTPAVHQMADYGPIPQLAATGEAISMPLLRDMDAKMYERQRGADLEIGSYAHRPLLHRPGDIPPLGAGPQTSPTRMPFSEADFAPQLATAFELFGELLDQPGVERQDAIDGLLSITPDGSPVLGETAEVAGLWSAAAVWIKEGPAVGRALAERIVAGHSEIDIDGADVARFPQHARSRQFVERRSAEGFPKIYGISHPREQYASERPMRTSPLHTRTSALAAEYYDASGWERPQWYGANAALLGDYAERIGDRTHEWDQRWWSPIIEAEHLAMRDRAAMFDLSAFAVFDVTGPGALAFLERMAANRVDRPVGTAVYTPMLDPAGRFAADLTIIRMGENEFQVITGANDGPRDLARLRRHARADVRVVDRTSGTSAIGLWGPRARDSAQRVVDADLSHEAFGFATAQEVSLGGVPATMLRISYVGELGWEIHVPAEYAAAAWDRLWAAGRDDGVIAAGAGVYGTTGRIEKAFRLMGAELTADRGPVEAGLAMPRVKDADFIGREAYLAERAAAPVAELVTLAMVEPLAPAAHFPTGGEPVQEPDGTPIADARGIRSYVTSAGPGPSLGRYLMLAYLPPERAEVGARLSVDYLGRRHPVEVVSHGRAGAFDPDGLRMRS
ncbi:GcvT family protein [Microbacterium halophytorum]|uniref:GcvT family protein n=1 Tax=Microbacterium halophytorum TaxID=2067568 RepID=UPI000CFD3A43|nr:FAD-dependent oxidoreductase [Microbacterium halophytorum]